MQAWTTAEKSASRAMIEVVDPDEPGRIVEYGETGRVRLNGAVKRNPETPVHFGFDRIEVDGRASVTAPKVYLMLNKPRGAVTTASDENGRQTVYDFLDRAGRKAR